MVFLPLPILVLDRKPGKKSGRRELLSTNDDSTSKSIYLSFNFNISTEPNRIERNKHGLLWKFLSL